MINFLAMKYGVLNWVLYLFRVAEETSIQVRFYERSIPLSACAFARNYSGIPHCIVGISKSEEA